MSFNPFQKRLNEKQPQFGQQTETKPAEDINPFAKRLGQKEQVENSLWNGFYDLLFSPETTPFEEGMGHSLRGIGTAVAGFPGDMIQMVKGASDWVEKKFPTPEFLKREPTTIQKLGADLLDEVPTTSKLIDKYDELTDGKYIPQNRRDSLLQEIGGDVSLLMMPARSIGQASKAIAGGVLGNLASEGMKELDFGEGVQAGTKIGTIMAVSMFNPRGVNKFADNLYKIADANVPAEAEISAKSFQKGLDNLRKELKSGLVNVESKKPVLNAINDIERNIKNGKVKIKDLVQSKKDLNEQRSAKVYDPEFKGTRQSRNQLKRNYGKLASRIDDSIQEYGKTNESFYKPYKEANQAWGGIEQSKKASTFMTRTIKNYKLATSLGALAGIMKLPGIGIGGAAAGYGGLKSYEMMHRIMMNPTLRKYYMNAVLEASKESAPGVVRNLQKMNSELKKMEEKI